MQAEQLELVGELQRTNSKGKTGNGSALNLRSVIQNGVQFWKLNFNNIPKKALFYFVYMHCQENAISEAQGASQNCKPSFQPGEGTKRTQFLSGL